jgi:spermidine/putrescine transport system substrate-binding protein
MLSPVENSRAAAVPTASAAAGGGDLDIASAPLQASLKETAATSTQALVERYTSVAGAEETGREQCATAPLSLERTGEDAMFDRRGFFTSVMAGAGALTLAVAVGGAANAADKELRVLNWQGWGSDQPFALADFEAATGYTVVHDYITSFPEMFTKLRTNPGTYDVVVINMAYTKAAADEGLIEPIDVSKLKNYTDLFAEMRDNTNVVQDGKVYGVSWIWGGTSITYDTTAFSTPPTSVQVLWDPQMAGRVCWVDRAEESIRFAAIASGQDPKNITDMDAVREKLRALKPQIKAFWKSEDEWLKLVAANECTISTIWTDSTEKAKEVHNLPVTFFVPEEGALGFQDALSIAKDPPNREAALAFIDYLIGPDFYAQWVSAGGAPVSANAKAIGELAQDSLTRQVLANPEAIARIHFFGPLSDETREQYLELWEETKAYYAE